MDSTPCTDNTQVSRSVLLDHSTYAGWYPIELLAWIQNQDPKIGIFLLAGKLIRILTFPLIIPLIFTLSFSVGLRNPQIPGPNSRARQAWPETGCPWNCNLWSWNAPSCTLPWLET